MHSPIIEFWTSEKPTLSHHFTLLLWNIHKCLSRDLAPDLDSLIRRSDIAILQEAIYSTKWKDFFVKQYEFCWGFFQGFHIPRTHMSSGVLTGSRYHMSDLEIHSTRHREPLLRTAKSSGVSYFSIDGRGEKLMIINTHAMNFNLGKPFRTQIMETIDLIRHHSGPMIWAGDFNTWSQGRKQYLQTMSRELGLDWLIPSDDRRWLQLDHILYRGVEPISARVESEYRTSDHKPITAEFRIV